MLQGLLGIGTWAPVQDLPIVWAADKELGLYKLSNGAVLTFQNMERNKFQTMARQKFQKARPHFGQK